MKQDKQIQLGKYLSNDGVCLAILFSFVFLIISPIIYFGIPNGYDLPQHYQFTFTYFESIKSGNLLPSWSAFENYGYGGIGIRIYPPLAHYLLALTQFLTGDWFTTSWLNFLFWLALGGLGSYLLARQWLSPINSLWVGMLYSIAPYHLSQLYQAFLYSEFTAAAILPFCFLFLTRVCRHNKIKDALLLGIFLSLLIISHIPTTLIGVITLGLYAIILLDWKKFGSVIPKLLLSGLIALLSTSFYWVKLFTELNLVNHSNPKYASGPYSYKLSFFPLIFNPTDLYFIKQMWLSDMTATFTFLLLLPFMIFAIWKIVKSTKFIADSKDYLAMFLTGGFAFFMASIVSSVVWANIQFIQKIQFPFRWLSVASLFGSLTFVLAISQISFQNNGFQTFKKYLLLVFFVVLFLFNISQIILPSETLSRTVFSEKLDGLLEKESYDCWWTIWSKPEAFEIKDKVSAQLRQVTISNWQPQFREFEVEQGEATNARIATFYYPHWQATVNGEKVNIEKSDDGTILIPLSTDKSQVRLFFAEPYFIKTADFISVISWLLLSILGIIFLVKRLFQTPPISLSKI